MITAENLVAGQLLSQVLQGIMAVPRANNVRISGVTADSRTVNPGDLFLACRQALSYVQPAIAKGAHAVIIECEQVPDIPAYDIPIIPLPQLRRQAGLIAAQFYGRPSRSLNVIGITGTNGKTTVSYLINQALSEAFCDGKKIKSGLIGSLGYGAFGKLTKSPNTTPEPVTLQSILAEMLRGGVDTVVLEVSSHGLKKYRTAGVEFDLAVFTNFSRDHLDYHQTMARYAAAKRRLFSDYGVAQAVINIDDDLGKNLCREFNDKIAITAYTLKSERSCDFSVNFPVAAAKLLPAPHLIMEVKTPWGEGLLESNLVGQFNAANLLAALASLCVSGMPFVEALARLKTCAGAPGRMECFGGGEKPLVVVDYAHSPEALRQVLIALINQKPARLFCVFGCGGERDRGKRPEMGNIAEQYATQLVLTNDNPRSEAPEQIIENILAGVKNQSKVTVELDRTAAITNTIAKAIKEDIVLVAGKGHEDYQEIAGVRHGFNDRQIIIEALSRVE